MKGIGILTGTQTTNEPSADFFQGPFSFPGAIFAATLSSGKVTGFPQNIRNFTSTTLETWIRQKVYGGKVSARKKGCRVPGL